MANYNKELLKELANSPQWQELDRIIDLNKERLKNSLLYAAPEELELLQGEHRGIATLQSLVNKHKEV